MFTEYMWTKDCKPISSEAMRKVILQFTTAYFDAPIGTQEYRQICVEIGRVFLGSEFEIRQEDMDVLASQAGHSVDMTRLRYAPEVGKIPSMSSDLLGRFARVSEAWWHVAGFRPGYAPLLPLHARQDLRAAAPSAPLQPGPTLNNAPEFDTQAIILAVASSVTAEMQKIELNLEAMIRKAVAEAMIQSQYPHMGKPNPVPPSIKNPTPPPPPVSEDATMNEVIFTHPFNSAPVSTGDIEMTDIYGLTRDHPEADPADFEVPIVTPSTSLAPTGYKGVTSEMLDALLCLHFPLVPSPTFKSPHQAQAVRLSVERQQSFVAVLPTGGGKSLTFTLPAFNPKEVGFRSYIIVPNRALLEDQIKHSKEIGLNVKWWTARSPAVHEEAQVVFLGMESAVSQAFKKYA